MYVIDKCYFVRRCSDGMYYSKKRGNAFGESNESPCFDASRKPRVYGRKSDASSTVTALAKGRFLAWVQENEEPLRTYRRENGKVFHESYRKTWTADEEKYFKSMYLVVEAVTVVLEEGETLEGVAA